MKINFLGDSITEGALAGKIEDRYTTLVANYFGAEECNFGVSGTRIAKQRKRTNNPDNDVFMCRAVKMPTDADFTFVFGGTNDYGHGDAKLGTFDDMDSMQLKGAEKAKINCAKRLFAMINDGEVHYDVVDTY